MKISEDKIKEATDIVRNGKEKCFSGSDFVWAITVLQEAFKKGYIVAQPQ